MLRHLEIMLISLRKASLLINEEWKLNSCGLASVVITYSMEEIAVRR